MSAELAVQQLARSGLASIGDLELLLRAYVFAEAPPDTVEQNLAAIAAVVDSLRKGDKGRGLHLTELLDAFVDLPPHSRVVVTWLRDVFLGRTGIHDVLDVAETLERVRAEPEQYIRRAGAPPLAVAGADAILAVTDSREAFEALVDAHASGEGLVPFVGAGMSRDSDFPLWRSFLVDAAKRRGVATEVGALLDRSDYEEAAQRVRDAWERADFNTLMRDTFARAVVPKGAVLQLPSLTAGPLVTTNYDRVLEEVYRHKGMPLVPVVGPLEDAFSSAIHGNGNKILLKLHGDAAEITNQVLTKEQYEQQYRAATAVLPALLRTLFVARKVLFLGCSFADQVTLTALAAVRDGRGLPPHFALLERPTVDGDKLRSKLSALNVQVVYYRTGSHRDVEVLLRALIHRAGARMRISKRLQSVLRDVDKKLDIPTDAVSRLDTHIADLARSMISPAVINGEVARGERTVRTKIDSVVNDLAVCRALAAKEGAPGTLLAFIDAARDAFTKLELRAPQARRNELLGDASRAAKDLRRTIRAVLNAA